MGKTAPKPEDRTFMDNLQYYLDEARKSPTDDPTLQPWIDAIQRESQESYDRSTYSLHDQLGRDSLLGTGYYGGMMVASNEEFNEAMQGQLADIYMGRFNQTEQNELAALGMLNNRDMNAANNRAQIQSSRISARPGMMQANLARQQWKANQPFTDIERTIGIMQGLNNLGGYTMAPEFVAQPMPYYGPSPMAAGFFGGLGGGLQGWGMYNNYSGG